MSLFMWGHQNWQSTKCRVLRNPKCPAEQTSWHQHSMCNHRTLGTYSLNPFQAKPFLCVNKGQFSWNHRFVGSALSMALGMSSNQVSSCGVSGACWVANALGCIVGMIAFTMFSCLLSYCGLQERASAKKLFPPSMYFKWKLNCLKYNAHLTCFGNSHHRVCRASRFLWPVQTSKGNSPPSSNCHQINRAHWTVNASFSHMGHCVQSHSTSCIYMHLYILPCFSVRELQPLPHHWHLLEP